MLEQFMEDCLPWERPCSGTGEECEEKDAAENMGDELTTTPLPHPPSPLGWRREKNQE